MTGINFVMNDKGEKSETDVMEFIEDLEDILAIELSQQDNNYSDWEDAKKRLRAKGIID